jgi:predicted PilT family ATPase
MDASSAAPGRKGVKPFSHPAISLPQPMSRWNCGRQHGIHSCSIKFPLRIPFHTSLGHFALVLGFANRKVSAKKTREAYVCFGYDALTSKLSLVMTIEAAVENEAVNCPYEMNDLLELMVDQEASDLHLQVNQAPTLRISGSMVHVEGPPLTPLDTKALMQAITSDAMQEQLKTRGGADFGFAFMDRARFRVSVMKAKGNYGMVLRTIPKDLFGLRQIGLPDHVKELLTRPRGLILVTGPTGSGKSTTLASMVNWINENRDGHIITIEDPIE